MFHQGLFRNVVFLPPFLTCQYTFIEMLFALVPPSSNCMAMREECAEEQLILDTDQQRKFVSRDALVIVNGNLARRWIHDMLPNVIQKLRPRPRTLLSNL